MLHSTQSKGFVSSARSRRLVTVIAGLAVAVVATTAARPAFAIKQFFDEFKDTVIRTAGYDTADTDTGNAVQPLHERDNTCSGTDDKDSQRFFRHLQVNNFSTASTNGWQLTVLTQ